MRSFALHIGTDCRATPRHQRWPPVVCAGDSTARMSRLCAAAGIETQRSLLGAEATCATVRAALACAAAELDRHGLFVLTFIGHSEREQSLADTRWCLHDGALPLEELAGLLAALPGPARAAIVSDTCFAGALAYFLADRPTLVLVAGCGEQQFTTNRRTSLLVRRLENLVFPGGERSHDCPTYADLSEQLVRDTPDAERPILWTNREPAWRHRPFDPAPPGVPASEGG